MSEKIKGKVVAIFDKFTLAINRGKEHGVIKRMLFNIGGQSIKLVDPDTKEVLGHPFFSKANVMVYAVFEKYSLARNFEQVTREVLPFPRYRRKRLVLKPLPLDDSIIFPEHTETVQVGDQAVQATEEKEQPENQEEEPLK